MKVLVINGSPRRDGNTSELADRFLEFIGSSAETEQIRIYGKNVKGCRNCGICQRTILCTYCSCNDGMSRLYEKFMTADVTVIASPIYMWQFTPCVIAFLTRLHCLCHSEDFSHNLLARKKMALLVTMGAEEEVADYAVNAFRDMCEFFSIDLKGEVRVPNANRQKIIAGEYDQKINDLIAKILA